MGYDLRKKIMTSEWDVTNKSVVCCQQKTIAPHIPLNVTAKYCKHTLCSENKTAYSCAEKIIQTAD